MSTFLSRVATRAAGAQASATPRPAALFEPTARSELVEAVSERIAAPPARPGASAAPASPTGPPNRVPPPPDARSAATADRQPLTPPAGPPVERIESPSHEIERVAERTPVALPGGAPLAQATSAAEPAAEHKLAPTPAAPRETVPSATAVPLPAPPPPPLAAEQRSEVRVHIGRLDVRANLQQAPPPPKREPDRAPELSLSDYLRGSRRA